MIEELQRAISKIDAYESLKENSKSDADIADAHLIAKRAVVAARDAIAQWLKENKPVEGSRPRKAKGAAS